MSIIPIISASEMIRRLQKAGFLVVGQKGSHVKLAHLATGRYTTVPLHGDSDLDRKLTRKIVVQAGLTITEFLKL